MPSELFVDDTSTLPLGDAVAAIIVLDDGEYVLQQRDLKPGIWYPDHWGCFGGGVDDGETPRQALDRELFEELQLEPLDAEDLCSFDFDLTAMGYRVFYRRYFVVRMERQRFEQCVLQEGRDLGSFDARRMFLDLRLTPYDSFALYLHANAKQFAADPA